MAVFTHATFPLASVTKVWFTIGAGSILAGVMLASVTSILVPSKSAPTPLLVPVMVIVPSVEVRSPPDILSVVSNPHSVASPAALVFNTSLAAPFNTIFVSILSSPIVVTPVLLIVTSPVTACASATPVVFPIKIEPSANILEAVKALST